MKAHNIKGKETHETKNLITSYKQTAENINPYSEKMALT